MIPVRTVIDTDTGVDDALAVLLAARSPELDVAAMTTVAGNAGVAECTRNVLLLAELAWPGSPPPVAAGAAAPLRRPLTTAPEVHGEDGLGGAPGSLPQPALIPTDTPAHDVLIETARADPGNVTLMATGPLTNLAMALARDPGSLARFRRIVVMGGALRVAGNTGPHAEFNFYVDPEAADIVLRAGLDVTVVPLDATTAVELSRERLEEMPGWRDALALALDLTAEPRAGGESDGERGSAPGVHVSPDDLLRVAVARALDHYIRFQFVESGLDAGYMHDPVALASAIAPGLLGTVETPLRVTTDGPERGRSVEAADARRPVRVAVNADRTAILELLTERVLKPLFG
ncbi:MAG: nucleoside hydrolase [Candidatus Eisenbacteria bacterium]